MIFVASAQLPSPSEDNGSLASCGSAKSEEYAFLRHNSAIGNESGRRIVAKQLPGNYNLLDA